MVPLDGIANSSLEDNYHDITEGVAEPGGVPFFLKRRHGVYNTSLLYPGDNSTSLVLPKPISQARSVYLLVNSGGSETKYEGLRLGEIQVIFSDGSRQTTNLVLGKNIREWAVGNQTRMSLVVKVEDIASQPALDVQNATRC